MPSHPPAQVTGHGLAPRREASSAWNGDAVESIPPPPAAAPEQLSLFVFEDVAEPRPPRLRRLRSLISALESRRHGPEALHAPPTRKARGPAAPVSAPPLWPDSFFD